MLTSLDAMLFPDDCEVVEILPHNRCIYLVQKNGSSSLRTDAANQRWKIFRNHDLYDLTYVDIYIRHPQERYLSGVNTFVQHLMRDNPDLDKSTCMTLALKYSFLNRHYLPQWHWVVNLARFLQPSCQLRLHPLAALKDITNLHRRSDVVPLTEFEEKWMLSRCGNLDLWFLMDQILLDNCGQEFTWKELKKIYQNHPARPMEIVANGISMITDVLR